MFQVNLVYYKALTKIPQTMSFWLVTIWIILFIVLGYLKIKFSYWELKGVKHLKTQFFFGNLFKLKSLNHTDLMEEIYQTFKDTAEVVGMYIYTKPVAVILDLNVIKAILIKDFHNFEDRLVYKNNDDVLSSNLFNVERLAWRPLRKKFSPTFTSGKMKFMFPTINNITQELRDSYERSISEFGDSGVDIYDLSSRYTIDVVGTCIMGLECNSLKNPNVEFRRVTCKIFTRTDFNIKWHLFKTTYVELFKLLGTKRYPKFVEDFFTRVTRDSVLEREKLDIQRKDFLNILIDLKKTKDENGEPMVTYDQISAQLFVFFVAGFESSATNMTFALYELARNPKIQEKVRQEILEVLQKYDNELTYEAMMEMTYLDQIITETVRLYPILSFIQRVALDDYKVPDTDIVLDKGTPVYIPARAIHYDPEIYENPLEFRPERFHPSQVATRHPQSFLGFGDGPRNCIALRFGRMQNLIGLVALLTNFKFSTCSRTTYNIKMNDHSLINVPLSQIFLKVEKI